MQSLKEGTTSVSIATVGVIHAINEVCQQYLGCEWGTLEGKEGLVEVVNATMNCTFGCKAWLLTPIHTISQCHDGIIFSGHYCI